jgi:hypothetical protein
MAKDFQQPWKNVTSANDEASAVRVLAGILTEKEGRAFVSRLERKDAEFCIEILDRVSWDSRLHPSLSPQMDCSEPRRKLSEKHRETGFL